MDAIFAAGANLRLQGLDRTFVPLGVAPDGAFVAAKTEAAAARRPPLLLRRASRSPLPPPLPPTPPPGGPGARPPWPSRSGGAGRLGLLLLHRAAELTQLLDVLVSITDRLLDLVPHLPDVAGLGFAHRRVVLDVPQPWIRRRPRVVRRRVERGLVDPAPERLVDELLVNIVPHALVDALPQTLAQRDLPGQHVEQGEVRPRAVHVLLALHHVQDVDAIVIPGLRDRLAIVGAFLAELTQHAIGVEERRGRDPRQVVRWGGEELLQLRIRLHLLVDDGVEVLVEDDRGRGRNLGHVVGHTLLDMDRVRKDHAAVPAGIDGRGADRRRDERLEPVEPRLVIGNLDTPATGRRAASGDSAPRRSGDRRSVRGSPCRCLASRRCSGRRGTGAR